MLDMLKKYMIIDCKLVATPMEKNVKLKVHVREILEDPTMYKNIVGSLIFEIVTWLDNVA